AGNVIEALRKIATFDFAGAFEAANRQITTSASKEIEAKQKAHVEALKNYGKDAANEITNISKQWDKVGLTKVKDEPAKESAVEKAVKKVTDNNTDKGGSGKKDKGKEMASNISSGGRPSSITLVIQKLTGIETLHTTNLGGSAKEAANKVVEELLMALNSVNAKAQASTL
ncbi:MAG TPA: hypothetical protein VF540_08185, partial [Segetibacter sp.]